MDGGSAEDKPCDRDSMEIFSAGTSELGINKLCGKNENQHIYIPVESAQVYISIRNIFGGRRIENLSKSISNMTTFHYLSQYR